MTLIVSKPPEKNLLATYRGPSTASVIIPRPWQVSLNGSGTPYIGHIAITDFNLKTYLSMVWILESA